MVPELQPVIMAAGEGSKMFPLTEKLPKCLLPVGNLPLIWYPVNYLERCGFQDLILIVRHASADKIFKVLQPLCSNTTKLDLVPINDEVEVGTAESLKMLKGKIKTDLLIMSCDTITDAPLHQLVDIYRMYDASLSVMLSKRVDLQPQVEQTQKGKKTKMVDPDAGLRDFVSIDPKEGRLLCFVNEGDLEQDNINLKKSLLKKYPSMKITSNLVDSHIYIIKKWLLEYLFDNEKFESIKSEFIPHVVRKQFSKDSKKKIPAFETFIEDDQNTNSRNSTDIFSYVCVDELTQYAKEWSGYQGNCLKDPIKCYSFVTNDFCLRINTLPAYAYINRQIIKMKEAVAPDMNYQQIHPTVLQHGKSQIGADCLVGESTSLGNAVTVKKSLIGKHCSVGSNVRITNSVIMDHVTIADGCTIQGCVLCDGCRVQDNCELNNCQVGANQTVQENSELRNESIVRDEMELDDDDDNDEDDIDM